MAKYIKHPSSIYLNDHLFCRTWLAWMAEWNQKILFGTHCKTVCLNLLFGFKKKKVWESNFSKLLHWTICFGNKLKTCFPILSCCRIPFVSDTAPVFRRWIYGKQVYDRSFPHILFLLHPTNIPVLCWKSNLFYSIGLQSSPCTKCILSRKNKFSNWIGGSHLPY